MRRAPIVLLLLVEACCDCAGDGVELVFVDPDGAPAAFEAIEVAFHGSVVDTLSCAGRLDCTTVTVTLPSGEGTYTLTIRYAGGTVAQDVEVVHPPSTPAVCCTDVFADTRTVVLTP